MADSSKFDFCVLGAGLAGLSIAGNLAEQGASVCLLETDDIASGASGTPLALVNPATGRFGTKTWRAEECYEAVANDLEKIQDQIPVRCFKKSGVLRPAQDEKMASEMKENAKSPEWPEGWCKWLDKKEVRGMNPNLNCIGGGIWLPPGLTVNVETYLKAKAHFLESIGLKLICQVNYSVNESARGFDFSLENGTEFHADSVICATGYQTKNNTDWAFLPVHLIKGQVAIFESPETKNFDYSISALGYIASISDSHFVAGSTYEHNFENNAPDKEGLHYLTQRLSTVYPSLFKNAELVSQWAGIRASSPNRKPILGRHPEKENLYIFSSLGSKGLLYSAYLGKLLTNFIIHQEELPKEISVTRFSE